MRRDRIPDDEEWTAFEWLERGYEARDVHLVFLTVDPKWDVWRADARFAGLLKRCGFTAPQLPAH